MWRENKGFKHTKIGAAFRLTCLLSFIHTIHPHTFANAPVKSSADLSEKFGFKVE